MSIEQDFETVREGIVNIRKRSGPYFDALDRIRQQYDAPRHQVPGNGGIMDVPCEDYEQYVVSQLRELRSQRDQAVGMLRKAHGTAQAMADMDSWIAQECGMVDDGTDYVIPSVVAFLSTPQDTQPLGECDGCGEDLFDGIPHDCPVLGTRVMATREGA